MRVDVVRMYSSSGFTNSYKGVDGMKNADSDDGGESVSSFDN